MRSQVDSHTPCYRGRKKLPCGSFVTVCHDGRMLPRKWQFREVSSHQDNYILADAPMVGTWKKKYKDCLRTQNQCRDDKAGDKKSWMQDVEQKVRHQRNSFWEWIVRAEYQYLRQKWFGNQDQPSLPTTPTICPVCCLPLQPKPGFFRQGTCCQIPSAMRWNGFCIQRWKQHW